MCLLLRDRLFRLTTSKLWLQDVPEDEAELPDQASQKAQDLALDGFWRLRVLVEVRDGLDQLRADIPCQVVGIWVLEESRGQGVG